jgi:hypothetical protein
MADNTRTCSIQQFGPIIFNSPNVQNAANTVYQNKVAQVTAATNGTLSATQATGTVLFKTNFERMQYLLGQQNQGVNGVPCGVAPKKFPLGTN